MGVPRAAAVSGSFRHLTSIRSAVRIFGVFRLIPREEGFFDLFEAAARNAHDAAKAFAELCADYTDVERKAQKIKDLEHAGDKLTHDTMTKLNQTFITPIDREDIHKLITRMDDVVDLIDTAVGRMTLYKIRTVTPQATQIAQVLVSATAILADLLPTLRNLAKSADIFRMCIDVHTQENEGDRITQEALASLFESGWDAALMIKWKDVYEALENATDRCEDVANIVEGIALKNA